MSSKSKYLFFNGSASVNCGFSPAFNMPQGAITVEVWLRPTSLSGWQAIVVRSGRDEWFFLKGAYPRTYLYPGGHYGDPLPINEWTHLAMTYVSGTYRLYANGVMIRESATTGLIADLGTAKLFFGARDGNDYCFNGHLADVRLWRVERTAEEIKANMNRRLGGHEKGLVGYWPLDEGTGFQVIDRSGTNNGTINNSGGWNEAPKECPCGPSWGGYLVGKHRRIVRVDARQNALGERGAASNFGVHAGQTISARVDRVERWSVAPGHRYGANGYVDAPAGEEVYPQYSDQSYVIGALAGSLDDGKTFFPVGSWLKTQVPREGNLTLYAWDQTAASNAGFLDAVIDVRPFKADNTALDRAKADGWTSYAVKAKEHSFGLLDRDTGEGLNTGLAVKPGDILRVVVDYREEWKVGTPSASSTANGVRFDQDKPEYLQLAGEPFTFVQGSLIGSLDKGETFFVVGTHLEMSALQAGTLMLYCATNTPSGATGTLHAYVHVEPGVTGAGWGELGGGSAGGADKTGPLTFGKIQKGTGVDSEWFELKNLSSLPVSLDGWHAMSWLQRQVFVFTSAHTVPAGGTVKFWTKAPPQPDAGNVALNQAQAMFGGAGELAMLFNDQAIPVSILPA